MSSGIWKPHVRGTYVIIRLISDRNKPEALFEVGKRNIKFEIKWIDHKALSNDLVVDTEIKETVCDFTVRPFAGANVWVCLFKCTWMWALLHPSWFTRTTRKQKHKRKQKYVWTRATQSQAQAKEEEQFPSYTCACACVSSVHTYFFLCLCLCLCLMLASYVWTSLKGIGKESRSWHWTTLWVSRGDNRCPPKF